MQFLVEAIAISTLGGLIGAGSGIAIAFIGSVLFKFPFIISGSSVIIGFGLSTVTLFWINCDSFKQI